MNAKFLSILFAIVLPATIIFAQDNRILSFKEAKELADKGDPYGEAVVPADMFSIYALDTRKLELCSGNDWANLKNLVRDPGPDFYDYNFAKDVSCIYIEEATPEVIYIDNERLNRQLGLFVHLGENSKNLSLEEYCNKGKNELEESGKTNSLLLPSIINIDVPLTLANQVKQYLDSRNINAKTLGLV